MSGLVPAAIVTGLALATVAFADCSPETLLRGAASMARGGGDARTRLALEACFADPKAPESARTTAAYLLTLGSDADVLRPREPHLAYLAEDETRWKALSPDARLRVRRLIGDNAYETARFRDAERAYERLVEESSGDLREYAVTKLGWTFMNVGTPDRARRLWAREADARTARGESVPSSWLHGWAQAFVEAGGPAEADVDRFCRLARGNDADEARASLLRGAVDGVPALRGSAALARVGRAMSRCPALASLWLGELGERFGGTERACALLSAAPPGTPYGQVKTLAQGCRSRLARGLGKAGELSTEARAAIESLTVEPEARAEAFLLSSATGSAERACRFALDALALRARRRDAGPLEIDPKATAAQCARAVEARQGFAKDAVALVETALLAGEPAPLADPRVYVVSQLLDVPTFRALWIGRLRDEPGRWRSSVLPALAAEKLRASDPEATLALYETFAAGRSDASPSGSVWESIRLERVSRSLDEKKETDALALLRRDAPAAGATGPSLRAWLRALGSASGDTLGRYGAEVGAVATTALASSDGRERLAALELLARAERWDAVVDALPKLAPKDDVPLYSDALATGIFDAAVRGRVPESHRLPAPALKALVEAGRAVGAGRVPEPWAARGTTKPLTGAVARLSAFGKRATRASSTHGESTAVVSRWVDVLAEGQRLVEKTTWPHGALAAVATSTLHAFCKGRAEALPTLRRPSQLSASEWSSVTEELGKQLGACVEAHGRSADRGVAR
jgi:hypothetical protein